MKKIFYLILVLILIFAGIFYGKSYILKKSQSQLLLKNMTVRSEIKKDIHNLKTISESLNLKNVLDLIDEISDDLSQIKSVRVSVDQATQNRNRDLNIEMQIVEQMEINKISDILNSTYNIFYVDQSLKLLNKDILNCALKISELKTHLKNWKGVLTIAEAKRIMEILNKKETGGEIVNILYDIEKYIELFKSGNPQYERFMKEINIFTEKVDEMLTNKDQLIDSDLQKAITNLEDLRAVKSNIDPNLSILLQDAQKDTWRGYLVEMRKAVEDLSENL
ncbi:MAG: hypothetical protein UR27_C0021G0008 [Candidatus Peregrinibacteria bacterium GW2011_GWA2_33_10]|nr:MAG: hypothetical protein UR27_C0021G0008 [Candidatus Peregrinibacteria bacterium GW2011_GWA2_33_10]